MQSTAIKNLRSAIMERKALYEATDPRTWELTSAIADISLHYGVMNLKQGGIQQAAEYLQILKIYTDPHPDSDWTYKKEWKEYRRDLFKNYSLYYQMIKEWGRSLESIKQGMLFES